MILFAIVTSEDFNQITNFILAQYPYGSTFKINGNQAANGTWFVYNPTAKPLFSTAIPSSVAGTCLQFRRDVVPSRTIGVPCNTGSYIICEYI